MDYTKHRYIPKGAARVANKSGSAVAYLYRTAGGKLAAIGYRGKAGNPSLNFTYSTEGRRRVSVEQFLAGADADLKHKAERQAEKRAALAKPHDVKVGDVFRCSWGYDQTNIDYYQVVELRGVRGVVIREIGCQSEQTGWLQGRSVPAVGKFTGEPMLKKLDERGAIRIYSFASAYRMEPKIVAGMKVFDTANWSAYA